MQYRVADYIANFICSHGVRNVHLLSGGGMMHILDAVGRKEGLDVRCYHHEQAAGMAAEAEARVSENIACCIATSGPGATNLVTAVAGAWLDSVPVIFITGQSKTSQTIRKSQLDNMRQFGMFEVDIVPIVRSITKYAAVVDTPLQIAYHLKKGLGLALSGRPGPILLDVPLDVQGAFFELEADSFSVESYLLPPPHLSSSRAHEIANILKAAKRPLIMAGHGVRAAGRVHEFQDFLEQCKIPVVTTALAKDLIPFDSNFFVGHVGSKGDRAGNFAVQNADVILSIGNSLHISTTGFALEKFAPNARIIQVDVDESNLQKLTVSVSMRVHASVQLLIEMLQSEFKSFEPSSEVRQWAALAQTWKKTFPVAKEQHAKHPEKLNYYDFVHALSHHCPDGSVIISDSGTSFYAMGQAFLGKNRQRFISSGGLGSMGYALPAAIGSSFADESSQVVCVTGDGSLLTNLQELQTLKHYDCNVKLFVVNNNGYLSIRNTQKSFFQGFLVGSSVDSGVSFPDFRKIADSFSLPYVSCHSFDMEEKLTQVFAMKGPVFCEVFALEDQTIIPTVASKKLSTGEMVSAGLDEMSPHLSDEIVEKKVKDPLEKII